MVRMTGSESDSASRQLARYIREVGALYMPKTFQLKMIFRQDRFLRGGEHTAFNEQGFASVRLTEYRENYNHSTRPHALKTASNMVTCQSSSISITWRMWLG